MRTGGEMTGSGGHRGGGHQSRSHALPLAEQGSSFRFGGGRMRERRTPGAGGEGQSERDSAPRQATTRRIDAEHLSCCSRTTLDGWMATHHPTRPPGGCPALALPPRPGGRPAAGASGRAGGGRALGGVSRRSLTGGRGWWAGGEWLT